MTTVPAHASRGPDAPIVIDLHCHTTASFDGVADPVALVERAARIGLTHLAVTDHDTIDGALRARDAARDLAAQDAARDLAAPDAAPDGLQVLIGSEVLTLGGDLVFVFLTAPIAQGLSAREAIEAGRAQGALVGIPHPYDHTRRSLLLDPENEALISMVDWVEAWNARVAHGSANERAAAMARRAGVPGVGVSDAHTLLEVGAAHTTMRGDASTPAGLRAALRGELWIGGPGGPAGPEETATSGRVGRWLRRRPGARQAEAAR